LHAMVGCQHHVGGHKLTRTPSVDQNCTVHELPCHGASMAPRSQNGGPGAPCDVGWPIGCPDHRGVRSPRTGVIVHHHRRTSAGRIRAKLDFASISIVQIHTQAGQNIPDSPQAECKAKTHDNTITSDTTGHDSIDGFFRTARRSYLSPDAVSRP
jgi:hypothetical protein